MVLFCFSCGSVRAHYGGNYRNGLFSEVRETGAYKVRPGGFRRSEGRRRSRCVGFPVARGNTFRLGCEVLRE